MGQRVLAVVVAVSIGAFAAGAAERAMVGLGYGGFLVGILSLDFSPLNEALIAAGYPTMEGPVVVFGGGGAGGLLGGAVFGGLGFGGSSTALMADRRTDLELGFGGVVIELARQATPGAVIGFGAVLGGGGLDLTVRARQPVDFADALETPAVSQFSLGFFGGLAYLRLQIQVLAWLGVEGWGGYFLAFPGQWEEGGREIAGPKLDLRAPFFGLRISFGGVGTPGEPAPRVDQVQPAPDVPPPEE